MTLSDLIYECGELPNLGPRVQLDIRNWINRAIHSISARRNWTFCHGYNQVTMLGNTSSITLGPTFKELAAERSPVSVSDPSSGAAIPVGVTSRAALQAYGWFGCIPYNPFPQIFNKVFLEQDGGANWTLNTIAPVQSDTTFNISGYWYPPELVLGTDSNGITNHPELADAVINKAKSLAYFSLDPTDPRGASCRDLYEYHYTQAAHDDASRRLAGRPLHW